MARIERFVLPDLPKRSGAWTIEGQITNVHVSPGSSRARDELGWLHCAIDD